MHQWMSDACVRPYSNDTIQGTIQACPGLIKPVQMCAVSIIPAVKPVQYQTAMSLALLNTLLILEI